MWQIFQTEETSKSSHWWWHFRSHEERRFWKTRPFMDRILKGWMCVNWWSHLQEPVHFDSMCHYSPIQLVWRTLCRLQRMASGWTLKCIKVQTHRVHRLRKWRDWVWQPWSSNIWLKLCILIQKYTVISSSQPWKLGIKCWRSRVPDWYSNEEPGHQSTAEVTKWPNHETATKRWLSISYQRR